MLARICFGHRLLLSSHLSITYLHPQTSACLSSTPQSLAALPSWSSISQTTSVISRRPLKPFCLGSHPRMASLPMVRTYISRWHTCLPMYTFPSLHSPYHLWLNARSGAPNGPLRTCPMLMFFSLDPPSVWEQYLFHYISTDGVVFLTMGDDSLGRRMPFAFLSDLQKKVRLDSFVWAETGGRIAWGKRGGSRRSLKRAERAAVP